MAGYHFFNNKKAPKGAFFMACFAGSIYGHFSIIPS